MTNHIKMWTPKEDDFLRKIVEQSKQLKWGAVAHRLQAEFQVYGRTGKQCRERWVNYLDPTLNLDAWTPEEENKLFEFHSVYGNRWSLISKQLNGRPDNNIKNHFYSALRKGLRRVNKFISQNLKRSFARPVPVRFISKILMVIEHGSLTTETQQQVNSKCQAIRNQLIHFSRDDSSDDVNDRQRLMDLVRMILEVNKSYRKKKAANKRNSDLACNKSHCETQERPITRSVKKIVASEDPSNLEEFPCRQDNVPLPFYYSGWAVTPIFYEQSTVFALNQPMPQPIFLSLGSNGLIPSSNIMLPFGTYTN